MQNSTSTPQNQTPPKTPIYKTWVFWVVVLYLSFIILYTLIFCLSEGENVLLPSNELGDFLAGAFAPLAFLFLILGYKQNNESIRIQSEELRASTEALQLQVAEMKESVDQQKLMSELQKTELEERHNAATPFISAFCGINVSSGVYGEQIFKLNFTFENKSDHDAKNVVFFLGHEPSLPPSILSKNSNRKLTPSLTEEEIQKYKSQTPFERAIYIDFENIYGRKFKHTFFLQCTFLDGSPQIYMQDLGMTKTSP
ncbi:hypothetical protein [Acinetobacter baumannii]|uniref:hypothetical protein n=1 Tax=Acinetobacter baumannii TaxID=470 RepID=UPI0028FC5936|nr:hypothetical protein [Acinetobacter baumannii]MDU0262685.1 hypothetical protein [Acinetobacter baumannii]MDU0283252.1 hypothetical protein [Acinetobacter baumannii]HAV3836678.1 hypothetical protein [Acinetobacter baumannii]